MKSFKKTASDLKFDDPKEAYHLKIHNPAIVHNNLVNVLDKSKISVDVLGKVGMIEEDNISIKFQGYNDNRPVLVPK